jgi:hypothetical protein
MAAGFYDDNLPNINDDQVKVWLGQAATTAVATATNISPVGTGTHYVDAVYAGDAVYTGSTSNLVPLLAQQVPTALTLTATPSAGSSAGQSVTLTATLNPFLAQDHSASGAVKFTSGSTTLGSANVSNGIATFTTLALAAGTDYLKAVYAGDTNFTASTSSILTYAVSPVSQTITFPQPATPAFAGTSVTLTATASSGLPVSYTVISGPATVSGSILTYTGIGTVVVEADQAGDATYPAATPVQNTVTVVALTEPVGTTSPVITTVVTFSAAGTPGSIAVLTQGATNLDFNFVAGGSCAVGTAYTAGQTCTVEFTFKPTRPGMRYGGIPLNTSAGALLGNAYISGIGTGPQVTFSPGTQRTIGSSTYPIFVAVDGAGDVYFSDQIEGTVKELVAVGGTLPASPVVNTLPTRYNTLTGIAIDGSGNLFVADGGADAVYEVEAVN